MKNLFKNTAVVVTLLAAIVACDTGVNTLGTDFLGVNVDDVIKSETFDVVAFSAALNPVQTNRFTSQPLGTYVDPVFGKTTYDFVTQVTIPLANPDFGVSVQLDSVAISIPLFSSVTGVEGENRTYQLDSIYNNDASTRFKIYENNFFLNSFDPQNLSEPARYYSDLGSTINNNKGQLIFEEFAFLPSNREIRLTTINSEGERVVNLREPPAYRKLIANASSVTQPILVSNIDYWKNKIFDQQGTANLNSVSAFQNYFRGLYFQVDDTATDANLTHFNVNDAAIIFYYRTSVPDITDSNQNGSTTDLIETSRTYRLEFDGNRANLIKRTTEPAISTALLAGGNTTTGDANLYLQGGPGSMAFVDLFGPDLNLDGEADALTALKSREVVINDAILTFYVDQSRVTPGATEPERIVIYDYETSRVLADFALGLSATVNAVNSNTAHLGRLERVTPGDSDSAGVQYRIRLTGHIANIINGNRENTRLGLAVSQNVEIIAPFAEVLNNNNGNNVSVERIFLGSALSHEGTILHGSNAPDPAKRPVFTIFYTEPN